METVISIEEKIMGHNRMLPLYQQSLQPFFPTTTSKKLEEPSKLHLEKNQISQVFPSSKLRLQ